MKAQGAAERHSQTFGAMGTGVGLWLWHSNEQTAQNALREAQRFFTRMEARLSRFKAESELSRLNRSAGRPFQASPLLFSLVADALEWTRRTGGIYDPAILPDLIRAGYDASFSPDADVPLASRQHLPPLSTLSATATDARMSQAERITLGPGTMIMLPAGSGIDLGGIAKGWSVQVAARRLGAIGPCLVDAGGDIATGGPRPPEPWVVSVAHPLQDDTDVATLVLDDKAIATSTRTRRRWIKDGRVAHHLIDPRTGEPARTNLLSATVVSASLPDAEIHAKTALILGEADGIDYLHSLGDAPSLLVCEDGRVIPSGSFEEIAYVEQSNFSSRFALAV